MIYIPVGNPHWYIYISIVFRHYILSDYTLVGKTGIMSDVSNKRVFRQIISPDRLHFALECLMLKILPTKSLRFKNSIVPAIISIHIDTDQSIKELKPIRHFLKSLRDLQKNHFVRFTTDILWACESDSTDIFYTFDGNIKDYCDISWNISIAQNGFIELTTKLQRPSKNHMFIYEMTRNISKYSKEVSFPYISDYKNIFNFLSDFYGKLHHDKDIRDIDSNFHILLVSDTPKEGHVIYYPIPIVGMNHNDAKRHSGASIKSILELYFQHEDLSLGYENTSPENIISDIMSMIIENLKCKNNRSLNPQTYRLAEMLVGYYLTTVDDNRELSTHDIILFQSLDYPSERGSYIVHVSAMDDIEL